MASSATINLMQEINGLVERRAGLPAFVVPYANADEANHAPNENLEIVRFIDGIRTGSALLEMIGETNQTKR